MFEEEYNSYDEIPASVRHLYVESGDKYVLIAAGQLKTVDDVQRVQEGLRKEREDHKATKTKLSAFNGLDPDDTLLKLDRIDELEAAAGGNIDENKINEMVETRLRTKTAPLERDLERLQTENAGLVSSVEAYKGQEKRRTIHDHIRTAAKASHVIDSAIEDALIIGERVFDVDETGHVITRDGVGCTPGVDASVWLTEIKQTRPHWWPESQGVGAKGGNGNAGGSNPFSGKNWNLTEQGRLIQENRARAEQMAKAAGTTIGGPRPKN